MTSPTEVNYIDYRSQDKDFCPWDYKMYERLKQLLVIYI